MSRSEKIGATILGLLLFSGLFYFIYTTMHTPLPADLGDEAFQDELAEDEAFDEELAPETEEPEEAPAASTATLTTPALK